jgi:hypothetical protein
LALQALDEPRALEQEKDLLEELGRDSLGISDGLYGDETVSGMPGQVNESKERVFAS